MSNPDPIKDALARLAAVADSDPVLNPMRGIRAQAGRNRRRATVLASAGVAAAVVLGYAGWAAIPHTGRADDPLIADTPTPPAATMTAIGPTLALTPLDSGQADVDGDGKPDQIRLMVPSGTKVGDPPTESWLEVRAAGGTATVQVTDSPEYVSFLDPGPVDLNADGTTEILMFTTGGGDGGEATIWTWVDGRLTRATPASGSPADLITSTGLISSAEQIGVASQDGKLFSWKIVRAGSQEVDVWQWALSGTTLTATQQPGTQCVSRGVLKPCR